MLWMTNESLTQLKKPAMHFIRRVQKDSFSPSEFGSRTVVKKRQLQTALQHAQGLAQLVKYFRQALPVRSIQSIHAWLSNGPRNS